MTGLRLAGARRHLARVHRCAAAAARSAAARAGRRVVRSTAGGPGAPERPGRGARSRRTQLAVSSDPGAPHARPRRMGLPGPVPDHAIARAMAHTQGTTPRLQRLSALVAIALVAIAVGFAFGRILVGHGATYRMIAVGLASGVLAWATERRGMLAGHARERRGLAARRHLARGPPRHVARAADVDHGPVARDARDVGGPAGPRVRVPRAGDARSGDGGRDRGVGGGVLLLRPRVPGAEPAAFPRPARLRSSCSPTASWTT